jgi:hypothetical protein
MRSLRNFRFVYATIFAVALGGVAMPGYADGVPCGNQDFVGSAETPGTAYKIELVGDTAYVIDRNYGLHVFDVSAPQSPTLLGVFDDAVWIRDYLDMQVEGSVVFLVTRAYNSTNRLTIIDASDPSNMVVIRSLDTEHSYSGFQVQNDTMYITNHETLSAIDISDLQNFYTIGTLSGFNAINGLSIFENLAYIPDLEQGWIVRIIDLSDPTFSNPDQAQIGYFEVFSFLKDLQVVDEKAYLAYQLDGMEIFDVSDPGSVTKLGSLDLLSSTNAITVVDSIAYLSAWRSGVDIIDVSDPTNPIMLGNSSTPGQVLDTQVANGMAYTAAYRGGLQIIDISSPSTPMLGSYSITTPDEYASIMNTKLAGSTLYASSLDNGLQIIDAGVPDSLAFLGAYQPEGLVWYVEVADDLAYVVVKNLPTDSGIHIVDISDPGSPVQIGKFLGLENLEDIVFDDGLLYAIDYRAGLHILDVNDPTKPSLVSTLDCGESISSIAISGDFVYLIDSGAKSGMLSVDVSDPKNPFIVHKFTDMPGGWAFGITINAPYAYVITVPSGDYEPDPPTGSPGGVHVIDISDPSTPLLLGTFADETYARYPLVQDNTVYLTDTFNGLRIIDVSNPQSPTLIGSFYPGLGAIDIEILGDTALIATNSGPGYIRAVDVSNDCHGCPADFFQDGTLDFFDITSFIKALAANEADADFNSDGRWNFFDISEFLSAFAAGCP